jgi:hypothetical protein
MHCARPRVGSSLPAGPLESSPALCQRPRMPFPPAGSLDAMFALYKELLPQMGGYLTHAGELSRSRLELFMSRLAQAEADVLQQRAEVGLKVCVCVWGGGGGRPQGQRSAQTAALLWRLVWRAKQQLRGQLTAAACPHPPNTRPRPERPTLNPIHNPTFPHPRTPRRLRRSAAAAARAGSPPGPPPAWRPSAALKRRRACRRSWMRTTRLR